MRRDAGSVAAVQLVIPGPEHLLAYRAALSDGWSANTERPEAAAEELALIAADSVGFLATKDDPDAAGPAITLPDGTRVERLPGFTRWLWDGAFCGMINMRWQPGTTDLPPHCLGHIGYSVVPGKRRRGYATRALTLMLPLARSSALLYVDLVTDYDNVPSQRVIEANGGRLVREFHKPPAYGGHRALLFRISLAE